MKRMSRLCIGIVFFAINAPAYSVLSHEAVVDAAWDDAIKPALLKRFPAAGETELRAAHAFAYGGSIVQDLGYYPFANRLFSDLTHYVKSGDFVENLIACARDVNEYAFALGALAHYVADVAGHPAGINRAVAVMYPKLRRKYGDKVSYGDDPVSHVKAEFAFDVVQVANQRYAPEAYHDFIGFEVPKELLERAFLATYGVKLGEVMLSVDLALGTYRYTVSTVIPNLTKAAWSVKENQIVAAQPGVTRNKFVYNLSRASFEREWGQMYERPSIWARICGFLIRLIPKFGPFRAFAFRAPTAEAEKLFMASFNAALADYRKKVAQVAAGHREFENLNLDTGRAVATGEYELADEAARELSSKLSGGAVQPRLGLK
jgi:hypothetical protein